jgi:hypothetical protein
MMERSRDVKVAIEAETDRGIPNRINGMRRCRRYGGGLPRSKVLDNVIVVNVPRECTTILAHGHQVLDTTANQ